MDQEVPTGFRFSPTEEELISFYLHHKLNNTRPEIDTVIPVVDIYNYHPSHLPQLAGEYCPADGEEWFFFIPRHEREARGGRPNRLTTEGYWKATGSPVHVYSCQNNHIIGRKRTMVFYVGRAPNGRKTPWKMNEYKAIQSQSPPSTTTDDHDDPTAPDPHVLREEVCLCRIYKRTKCLRAYDRRPGVEQLLQINHQHNTTINNNNSNNHGNNNINDEGAAAVSMAVSDQQHHYYNEEVAAAIAMNIGQDDDDQYDDVPIWSWDWEQHNWPADMMS